MTALLNRGFLAKLHLFVQLTRRNLFPSTDCEQSSSPCIRDIFDIEASIRHHSSLQNDLSRDQPTFFLERLWKCCWCLSLQNKPRELRLLKLKLWPCKFDLQQAWMLLWSGGCLTSCCKRKAIEIWLVSIVRYKYKYEYSETFPQTLPYEGTLLLGNVGGEAAG